MVILILDKLFGAGLKITRRHKITERLPLISTDHIFIILKQMCLDLSDWVQSKLRYHFIKSPDTRKNKAYVGAVLLVTSCCPSQPPASCFLPLLCSLLSRVFSLWLYCFAFDASELAALPISKPCGCALLMTQSLRQLLIYLPVKLVVLSLQCGRWLYLSHWQFSIKWRLYKFAFSF